MRYEVFDPKTNEVIATGFNNLLEVSEFMDSQSKFWMVRTVKEPVDLGELRYVIERIKANAAKRGRPL
jgi:hypothetical protein